MFSLRLNVALTFNVKPESETFPEEVPSFPNNPKVQSQTQVDTYAEWDTWSTINAVKEAIECFHNVTLIEADHSAFQKLKN